MNNISNYVTEKLIVKNNSKTHSKDNAKYACDWQWFNNLICNVQFEEDQLRGMFANLTDDELKVWIKEVQDCYVGTDQEEMANKIGDDIDLARFYFKNPVTE